MQRAGQVVFDGIRARYPNAKKWLICCGSGNNAGDGYVVARLAHSAGLSPVVCALKTPEQLNGDAATAAQEWKCAGGESLTWPIEGVTDFDLLIDALIGTGLDRPLKGDYAKMVFSMNKATCPVISVDIPSGLHADSGNILKTSVIADATYSFIGQKRGLFTADGPDCCGLVQFSDLDVPAAVFEDVTHYGYLLTKDLINQCLKPRKRNAHKGSFGSVLSVGGDIGMSGAVRLCGEAALRSGAGKVTLLTRSEHAALVNITCPELMTRAVESAGDLQDLTHSVNVVILGIGLGQSRWSQRLFDRFIKADLPLVLDADGLNILAKRVREQGESVPLPAHQAILTPHPLEAGRLLNCTAKEVQSERVEASLELARQFQAVVVLKGCGTVVARPDGRYAICSLGNPGMATAGSGDVLSGVIGAMLAQGLDSWHAAIAGVTAHAYAGDLAAENKSEAGMIASDIIDQLPQALKV